MRKSVCKKCGVVFESNVCRGSSPHRCPSCRQSACEHCGILFERKPRSNSSSDALKYCSKKCYFSAIKAGTQRFRGFARGLSWQLACWAEDWAAQCPEFSECRWCKKESHGNAYCSRKCESRWHHFSNKPSDCVECGKSLAGLMYQSRSMCEDCRKKRRSRLKIALRKKWAFLRRIRNRCKRFGVAYDPAVKSSMVFERDSFACQICRKQCLKKFRWIKGMPHPLSPTVDHITPLSWRIRGHTWDNVQCACWSCNVHKSNKSGGQLRFSFEAAGGGKKV